MSSATLLNGKPRKQLADQLDRLDGIIDVLGEGLNEAVVSAMRDGARLAVKDALVEILTNPEFLTAFQTTLAPTEAVPAKQTIWERVKARLALLRRGAANAAIALKNRIVRTVVSLSAKLGAARDRGMTVLNVARGGGLFLRRMALTATFIGVLTGMVALVTPHEIVAAVGAVASAIVALALQIVYRTGRLLQILIPVPQSA